MLYTSAQQLLDKAQSLAGLTLEELAKKYQAQVPKHLLKEKGWIGQFLEYLLGAESGSLAQPDFPEIGVEMKTLPIDRNGKPLESTYVSVLPLKNLAGLNWDNSVVCHKLSHVLWIPIVADKHLDINQRSIGMPFLWQPTESEIILLKQDFDDVIDKVAMGRVDEIDARFGEVMQVRPKAANSKALTEAIGPEGESILTLPRGFYLRPQFTHSILRQFFD